MEQTIEPLLDDVSLESLSSQAQSATSWPAIIAGAFVAASVSLVLLAVGSGLGFASISPWPNRGVSATTFTVSTAIWLIVTQWVSAGMGGYVAGRLRIRWVGTHTHEVFFRDTAHGLVTWALAVVLTAAAAITSFDSLIGSGLHAVSESPATMAERALSASSSPAAAYRLDVLFRTTSPAPSTSGTGDPRLEAGHILADALVAGGVPDTDRSYLADLVAARTGISQAEAQKRVNDFVAGAMEAEMKARASADAARKALMQASIYTALSLLVGAFIASVSAALGGRQRDAHR
jgi:hypothetical protein